MIDLWPVKTGLGKYLVFLRNYYWLSKGFPRLYVLWF